MALTNKERIGRMLDGARRGPRAGGRAGLQPGVRPDVGLDRRGRRRAPGAGTSDPNDPHFLLNAIWFHWQDTLGKTLGKAERNYVAELRLTRNRWAHPGEQPFTRRRRLPRLDTAERLLRSVAAPQADELGQGEGAILMENAVAQQKEKQKATTAAPGRRRAAQGLAPWREPRHPASRCRRRPLRAGGVRRGPRPGRPRRGRQRVRRPARVLRAHVPHRGPAAPPDRRAPAAGRDRRRPGRRAPDQLRRRQDALDARALPPRLRRSARRACPGSSASSPRPGWPRCRRYPGRARRDGALAGQPRVDRRPRDPHAVGRARLAARRRGRVRDARRGRPDRRHARAPTSSARSSPTTPRRHPHRRVGDLHPPAVGQGRPARRDVRRHHLLRPAAHRGRRRSRARSSS